MNTSIKTQKIITSGAVALAVFGSFFALIRIVNLNQIGLFAGTLAWTYGVLAILMGLLFDLHFKNPGSFSRARKRHENITGKFHKMARVLLAAFWERVEHLRSWRYAKHFIVNFMLPGFLFWGTAGLLFVNMGMARIQAALALVSGLALVANFWFLKEIFHRRKEVADRDIFIIMTVVKIYASAIMFAASMALVKRYCLSPWFFVLGVFAFAFLLIFQALFQHKMISVKNIAATAFIAVLLALAGYGILANWGYNYFTAAALWTAFYNLLWGAFHYHLDKALTKKAFFEILAIALLVAAMVFSVTNFKARIIGGCDY